MKYTRTRVFKCLVFVFATMIVHPSVFAGQSDASIEKNMDQILAPLVDSNLPDKERIVGIWGGVISGNQEFGKGYGSTSKDFQKIPSEKTLFEIGSISKTFTAVLLAKAGLQNLLSLNDPIQEFLPSQVKAPEYNGQPIQLWQLASHASGLPRMPDNFKPKNPMNPYIDYEESELYEFLNNHQLARAPEAEYEYSNLAAGLLGHLLAKKYGKTYQEALVDEVLSPLGLQDTRVRLTAEQEKRFADGYLQGNPTEHWQWGAKSVLNGCGGLRSSGRDLMVYAKANLGLTSSEIDAAITETHQPRYQKDENMSVGLGWHIYEDSGILMHGGGTYGFRTFIAIDKVKQKAVVLLTNTLQFNKDESNVSSKLTEVGLELLRQTQ